MVQPPSPRSILCTATTFPLKVKVERIVVHKEWLRGAYFRFYDRQSHRRIADEYCGGAAVTKFPTKYFRIEFMRREFVVRVIVLYS